MINESDIDVALARVLLQRFRVGAFDAPSVVGHYRSIPVTALDTGAKHYYPAGFFVNSWIMAVVVVP